MVSNNKIIRDFYWIYKNKNIFHFVLIVENFYLNFKWFLSDLKTDFVF
jgi:hypothetical protein